MSSFLNLASEFPQLPHVTGAMLGRCHLVFMWSGGITAKSLENEVCAKGRTREWGRVHVWFEGLLKEWSTAHTKAAPPPRSVKSLATSISKMGKHVVINLVLIYM
jgi:hypothetical protein